MTIQTYSRLECHFLGWSDGVFVVWMALNLQITMSVKHFCEEIIQRQHIIDVPQTYPLESMYVCILIYLNNIY
jgi:hypothetical protein